LDNILSQHLNKIIEQFLFKLSSDPNDAEKLIKHVEAGCQYFRKSARDILDARLEPLKKVVEDYNSLEAQKWANQGEDPREEQKRRRERGMEEQKRLEEERRRKEEQELDWRHVFNAEK